MYANKYVYDKIPVKLYLNDFSEDFASFACFNKRKEG